MQIHGECLMHILLRRILEVLRLSIRVFSYIIKDDSNNPLSISGPIIRSIDPVQMLYFTVGLDLKYSTIWYMHHTLNLQE